MGKDLAWHLRWVPGGVAFCGLPTGARSQDGQVGLLLSLISEPADADCGGRSRSVARSHRGRGPWRVGGTVGPIPFTLHRRPARNPGTRPRPGPVPGWRTPRPSGAWHPAHRAPLAVGKAAQVRSAQTWPARPTIPSQASSASGAPAGTPPAFPEVARRPCVTRTSAGGSAAQLCGDRLLYDLEGDLIAAFERPAPAAFTQDPPVHGQGAIARALVAPGLSGPRPLPCRDPLRQPEPVWGGTSTRVDLRATCALGLVQTRDRGPSSPGGPAGRPEPHARAGAARPSPAPSPWR